MNLKRCVRAYGAENNVTLRLVCHNEEPIAKQTTLQRVVRIRYTYISNNTRHINKVISGNIKSGAKFEQRETKVREAFPDAQPLFKMTK